MTVLIIYYAVYAVSQKPLFIYFSIDSIASIRINMNCDCCGSCDDYRGLTFSVKKRI